MLVAGDVYRPAAIDQLSILGKQVLEFYCIEVGPSDSVATTTKLMKKVLKWK